MKNNNHQNIFYWTYLVGFFAILMLPAINVPPLFFPAAWGQSMLFKIILTILFLIFAAEMLLKVRPWGEALATLKQAWLPLIFFGLISVTYILATIFSLQPHFSFWGDPARAGGTFNFLLLQAFAVLVFLVVREQDWKKILNVAFIGGILVCFIAIAQQFGLIDNDILIHYVNRPPGSLGNTDFMAAYLLLLFFPALVFGLKEKHHIKRMFYFGSALFFIAVIALTISRAAYLALAAGAVYFLLFYRLKSVYFKRVRLVAVAVLCMVVVSLVYYANSRTTFLPFIEKTPQMKNFITRLSWQGAKDDARVVVWKDICVPMLKDNPLFGYGPENFSIGFDKYYDPSLPSISKNSGSWWDKAHNFFFDTIFAIGIPGLIAYLIFYAIVFWKLEKEKRREGNSIYIIHHGLQTAFVAYFINNLFSFDTFATYLVFFFLISYTFYLTSNKVPLATQPAGNIILKTFPVVLLVIISLLAGWFIFTYVIQPLQIRKEINYATYFSGCTNIQGLERVLQKKTFLDTHLRLEYAGALRNCMAKKSTSEKDRESIAKKGIVLLKEAVQREPYYVRAWIYLAAYSNILLDFHPEDKGLNEESDYYFKKSIELAPGHSEIYVEWTKKHIHLKEYQQAVDKADICISLNSNDYNCYFYKAIAYIYLKDFTQVQKYLAIASQKGYDIESKEALEYLAKSYVDLATSEPEYPGIYQRILPIYQKLTNVDPDNFQYHASLAFTYKMLGQYAKARDEALKVIQLSPASRQNVEEFLKSLPQ